MQTGMQTGLRKAPRRINDMSLELFFTFGAISLLIAFAPGPITLYAANAAFNRGAGVAWAIIPGVLLGDACAMVLSFLGVGLLLAASPLGFSLLKTGGSVLLIYIGLRSFMERKAVAARDGQERAGDMQSAFLLALCHPGAFVFYGAFFPQFIERSRPAAPQLAMLGAMFLLCAGAALAVYIIAAGLLKTRLEASRRLGAVKKLSGGCMIALGAAGLISVVLEGLASWRL